MSGAAPGGSVRESLARLGPVGTDLLAVDWDGTSVGPPEQWEHSLATVVTTVLGSRFSMWMAWGEDLTFFCNDAYRRDTLGVKYPWALGRPAREVWSEIWDDIGPRIDRVLRTGEATWDEGLLLFLQRSGFPEETYHTFSYSPLRGADGRVAGMLCVVSEDTGRVVSQRRINLLGELAGSVAGLQREEEILAAVAARMEEHTRTVPFSIGYLLDPDGSGRARRAWVSGIAAGHPAAPPVLAAGGTDPWPIEAALEGRATAVRFPPAVKVPAVPGWPVPPDTAMVVPLLSPGGTALGALVAALNPCRPLDGSYEGFFSLLAGQVATAISGARAYEEERRRAEALAELDAAKTAFFTNVSHELRTPLTLILGPIEDALADRDDPIGGPHRARLELVGRNAGRLLHLVNNLLDFSRLQSGATEARFEATDLARETAEVASMFEAAAARAGLTLTVEAPPLPEPVWVDRDLWSRIVVNLVANALKYTFSGGITVSVRAGEGSAELSVSDTGVGIPAADQGRLFERFHRVAGARGRSHEGSGIGLALVAELAELHGGTASVESTPGVGSTFRVRVPLGADHLPEDRRVDRGTGETVTAAEAPHARAALAEVMRWLEDLPAPEPAPAGARTAGERAGHAEPLGRVLVVDDNPDMRRYVARLLAGTYEVRAAADGLEALEIARRDPPDLVLTDVMMPDLDGFGLLRALRSEPATAGIPVVMLSARAGAEGTVEGLEAGADDYLAKPFAAPELLARIRANLELDRTRRVRATLERSQALMDQAQRMARVGSWEVDLVSGAISVSDELVRLVGVRRTDLEARSFLGTASEWIHPDDRPRVDAALAQGISSGSAFGYEARLIGRGGSLRWVRVRGEVATDSAGRATALRGFLQDITEQREAEGRLAAAAAAAEAAAREHRIADELQAALLPTTDADPDHLEVATYYQAGTEGTQVGGDWYDVVDLGAGRTALVLGDVMGRGVRAAAVMGQLRSAIRAYARLGMAPADVLECLDGVVRDLNEDQIVTCVYAVHDASEGTLTWANAGHLPPLVVGPDARVTRLDGAGPPLGTGPLNLREWHRTLRSGEVLALYTDGLVERRDRDLDAGISALAGYLAAAVRGHLAAGPHALVRALLPDGSRDDVAILLARVPADAEGAPAEQLDVAPEASAVAAARRFVQQTLTGWDVREERTADVVLVVSELVGNAVVHGRPPIRLALRTIGPDLVVEVRDHADATPRRLRPTTEDEHGRGLQMVGMLASRWGVRPGALGKCVWATFPLERDGPGGAPGAG